MKIKRFITFLWRGLGVVAEAFGPIGPVSRTPYESRFEPEPPSTNSPSLPE